MSTTRPQPPNISSDPQAGASNSSSSTGSGASTSVFTKFGPVSSPGTDEFSKSANLGKYGTGDPAKTYPLYALWIMLTTENWDKPFEASGFADQLFQELVDAHLKANPAEKPEKAKADLLQQLQILHRRAQQHSAELQVVRDIWDSFLTFDISPAFYGGRPCPGGGSLLDVANLKNQQRS